jgi:streptogramin lyase
MKRQALLMVLILGHASLSLAAGEVRIVEWDLPTARAFPHDPAVAPDGALWYTGMRANNLGRLDLATGQIREYPLHTPDSGPHGLVADREGNIWFTANAKGYIGKLDPRSGTVRESPPSNNRPIKASVGYAPLEREKSRNQRQRPIRQGWQFLAATIEKETF